MTDTKIKLRPIKESDADAIAVLANNKKIWDNVRNKMPFPYAVKDAEYFIGLKINEDPVSTFVIEYEGQLSGLIGLHVQEDVYCKSAELGYWIGEPFWRKGIASEAVKLILNYGFETLNLSRIFAATYEYNTGSMKVLKKNGFRSEGIARKAVFKNNAFYDEHRFGKLKGE